MKEFESNTFSWQTLEEIEQMMENKRVYSTKGDRGVKMVREPSYQMHGVHDVFKTFNNQNADQDVAVKALLNLSLIPRNHRKHDKINLEVID